MATKLNQLLDELIMLKEYFAQDLLMYDSTETVVLKEDLEELITKYTETTPTYKPGDSVRVIDCLHGHEFCIGLEIKLIKYNAIDQLWYCSNNEEQWWLNIEEFEPIK